MPQWTKLMVENQAPVRIAVNVMRARLTLIGFNIAIVSFQISQLYRLSGGVDVSGLDYSVHVAADMALYMALALSLIALVAFIGSCGLDEIGYCTHWSLVAGDLLMYLGLAQTFTGFFAPLAASIMIFSTKLPDQAAAINSLQTMVLIAGGSGWFLATYLGPAVSLVRSPFSRMTNIMLGFTYLVLLLVVFTINAQSLQVEALSSGDESKLIYGVLKEFIQPFRW